MVDVPASVKRQVVRAERCLADPDCADDDVEHEFAIAFGALLTLLRQADAIRPASRREKVVLRGVTSALTEMKESLLRSHDAWGQSRYAPGGTGGAFRAEVRTTLADISVLPGKTLDIDDPDLMPANQGRWVGALRHIAAELAGIDATTLPVDVRARLVDDRATAARALSILEEFWQDVFEIMFVTDDDPPTKGEAATASRARRPRAN